MVGESEARAQEGVDRRAGRVALTLGSRDDLELRMRILTLANDGLETSDAVLERASAYLKWVTSNG